MKRDLKGGGDVWRRVGLARPPGLYGNVIVCVYVGMGDNGVEEVKVIVEEMATGFRGEMKK